MTAAAPIPRIAAQTGRIHSATGLRHLPPGQAMVEFLIVLPVMLLIVLGTLQFAFIYHAKMTLNYAAFEAARAGSLNSIRPYAMERALARGLAPLFTHRDDIAAYKTGREKVLKQIEDGYLRIEVVNPPAELFADRRIAITTKDNRLVIPNDNLIYRGTSSRPGDATLQDANLLKIQVYYCYELIVPLANRILWTMLRYAPADALPPGTPEIKPEFRVGAPAAGSFSEECIVTKHDNEAYYGLPIRAQGIVRMQSAAELPPGT